MRQFIGPVRIEFDNAGESAHCKCATDSAASKRGHESTLSAPVLTERPVCRLKLHLGLGGVFSLLIPI